MRAWPFGHKEGGQDITRNQNSIDHMKKQEKVTQKDNEKTRRFKVEFCRTNQRVLSRLSFWL